MRNPKLRSEKLIQAEDLIHEVIENSPRVNIILKDGSQINNVYVYSTQQLYDSILDSKERVSIFLNGDQIFDRNQTIYFSNEYIQGGISSVINIENWEFVEED
jgi:hypothetical protein